MFVCLICVIHESHNSIQLSRPQPLQVFAQGKGVPIETGHMLVEKLVANHQYNEDVWASS